VTLIVPGDSIQKTCTFAVAATGDHLEAAVTAPSTVTVTPTPAAPSLEVTVAATYDVNGTALADGGTITEANDGQTLSANFVVTFPYGTDAININDTQDLNALLGSLTVTLTQQDPSA
jgi:alternate signal-mediated exported protein